MVGVGGPCYFSVSLSPFGLDFGTLDFGLGLDNNNEMISFNIMFGFEQMFWAPLSILRHFKSPLQFSRVMAHSCFDKVKSWFLLKNFRVYFITPLSSQCYLLRCLCCIFVILNPGYIWRKLEEEDECNEQQRSGNMWLTQGDHTPAHTQSTEEEF